MSQYYVYAYLNPLRPCRIEFGSVCFLFEPFYIGKGKNNRMFDHIKEARPTRKYKNSHKLNTIRKIQEHGQQPYILVIEKDLSEPDALATETEMFELRHQCRLTNIRLDNSPQGNHSHKGARRAYNNPRKDTVTIYLTALKEHRVIKKHELAEFQQRYGNDATLVTTGIKFRQGTKKQMARHGDSNGMRGKSAVAGRKWCIVDGRELFLSAEEIDNLKQKAYHIEYGRLTKPKTRRIIFEGELKGKYRDDAAIAARPDTKYQYGLVWNASKPTYMNHQQL